MPAFSLPLILFTVSFHVAFSHLVKGSLTHRLLPPSHHTGSHHLLLFAAWLLLMPCFHQKATHWLRSLMPPCHCHCSVSFSHMPGYIRLPASACLLLPAHHTYASPSACLLHNGCHMAACLLSCRLLSHHARVKAACHKATATATRLPPVSPAASLPVTS